MRDVSAEERAGLAKLIAHELGFSYELQHRDKPEWNKTRGEKGGRFHDVNEPYQDDFDQTTYAIIAAGWRPQPTAPSEGD